LRRWTNTPRAGHPAHLLGVEHGLAAREGAEPAGLERTELRGPQRLDADRLGAGARGRTICIDSSASSAATMTVNTAIGR